MNKAVKKSKGDIPDDKLQFSLMSLFQEQKEEAQTLKSEIDKTDKEIDQMVYELYGLSKEEIEIIESNWNIIVKCKSYSFTTVCFDF